jgi:hypothetical protein
LLLIGFGEIWRGTGGEGAQYWIPVDDDFMVVEVGGVEFEDLVVGAIDGAVFVFQFCGECFDLIVEGVVAFEYVEQLLLDEEVGGCDLFLDVDAVLMHLLLEEGQLSFALWWEGASQFLVEVEEEEVDAYETDQDKVYFRQVFAEFLAGEQVDADYDQRAFAEYHVP